MERKGSALIIERLKFSTQMKTGKYLSFKNKPTIILNVVFDQRSFIRANGSEIHFKKMHEPLLINI